MTEHQKAFEAWRSTIMRRFDTGEMSPTERTAVVRTLKRNNEESPSHRGEVPVTDEALDMFKDLDDLLTRRCGAEEETRKAVLARVVGAAFRNASNAGAPLRKSAEAKTAKRIPSARSASKRIPVLTGTGSGAMSPDPWLA